MDRKATTNLFDIVAIGDDIALLRLLLEGNGERNIATLAHGNTVLHEASWKGYSRCVKILCNAYPKDLDENNKEKLGWKKGNFINRVNFCGFTALHLAAQNGHNQTLRELLYAGSSTSIQNDYGDTALHTACRYGHAGVVRILISAKCDVNALNLNHDTPLHITCAMGRRKLTRFLLDAGAMQFSNLHHETPREIAERKNLHEILEIINAHSEKFKEPLRNANSCKSPTEQKHLMSHNDVRNRSPYGYGCHNYPDTRNFPLPNLESLPKEPLHKGEQYFLDLAGNIRKGPVGKGNTCFCETFQNASNSKCRRSQKRLVKTEAKLDEKISLMIDKKINKDQHRDKSKDRDETDPLYPLMRVFGDKDKQLHLENWLRRVYPCSGDNGSLSDLFTDHRSSQKEKQIPVEIHNAPATVLVRSNSKMPEYDENGNNEQVEENDDSYTDISDDADTRKTLSSDENPLYDEVFLLNFQQQQLYENTHRNDSVTSPSVNSTMNQSIEMEMKRIAKSLMIVDGHGNESEMISRNPDVIKDHIHHSARRRRKNKLQIKNAIITKSSNNVLASGELYVNSFFNQKPPGIDEADSSEMDQLVQQIQKTVINSSNMSAISSIHKQEKTLHNMTNANYQDATLANWNEAGRSRNPLPMDIDEIEKYSGILQNPPIDITDDCHQQVETSLNDNNFMLLDKLLKARKRFNHTYQQQLEAMNNAHPNQVPSNSILPNESESSNVNNDYTIPSNSTLV